MLNGIISPLNGFGSPFGRSRGSGFSPASLFTTEKGGYYDPSDAAGLWQDDAATTPVTASGQLVKNLRVVYPGGGAGGNFIQTDDLLAPTYIEENGAKYLRITGHALKATGVDLSGATAATFVIAIAQKSKTSAGIILEHGTAFFSGTGGLAIIQDNGAPAGNISAGAGLSAGNRLANNGPAAATPRTIVVTVVYNPSGATDAEKVRVRINGEYVALTNSLKTGTITNAIFASRDLYMGARAGTSVVGDIDMSRGLFIARLLTEAELISTEAWASAGITETEAFESDDSRSEAAPTAYPDLTQFSSVSFDTSATSMTVGVHNTIFGDYPELTAVGVIVDGVYNQSIEPSALGRNISTIALPEGSKRVTLVNGPQSRPSSTIIGTWVDSVSANAALVQAHPSAANRLLIYGDSISAGSDADTPHQNGWAPLVRAALYPRSVAVEGWGFRSLHDDASDGTKRAAFVATLGGYAPSELWLAIGTNDYGLNKWSAASFGTAYAALLDDLNTALPSLVIYCQTPLLRSVETANGSGSTLGDYRTQITTAVSTRTAYATLVDGTAIMTTASLADGVHPTTAGHLLYANYVLGVI